MNKENIDEYKNLGWVFTKEEHFFNEKEWSLNYKSPRMNSFATLKFFKLNESIEEMLYTIDNNFLKKEEVRVYAGQFYKKNQCYIQKLIRESIENGKKSIEIELE